MRALSIVLLAGLLLALASHPVLADDLEGRVDSVNSSNRSFTLQGIEFFVTPSTDYDDGLESFDDLNAGQKIEVDFEYRNGKHIAVEIERED
ncbi:MAG: DUF5666 domain-containing protein [Desulfobacterales bacterium]